MSTDKQFNYTYKLLQSLCKVLGAQNKFNETMESITSYIVNSGNDMLIPKSINEELLIADIRFHLIKNNISSRVESFINHHETLKASKYGSRQRQLLLVFLLSLAEDRKSQSLQRIRYEENSSYTSTTEMNNEMLEIQTIDVRSNGQDSSSDISDVYIKQHEIISPYVLNDEIVQNIIYSFTGVNGKYVQKDELTLKFRFNRCCNLPYGIIDKIIELSELGYYHNKLKMFTSPDNYRSPVGLMGQSLLTAYKNELTFYYGKVAALQDQFNYQNSSNKLNNRLGLLGLTLWAFEPIHRMGWLTKISDACEGKMGGPLANSVYQFINHGDSKVVKMVKDILSALSSPLKKMISNWLLNGKIIDPFDEFFINVISNVEPNQIWNKKFHLRTEMIPEFIPIAVADQILNTGKMVHFLREICNDVSVIRGTKNIKQCLKDKAIHKLKYPCEPMNCAINELYTSLSTQLLDIVIKRFKFIEHLTALRSFLLLGLGDFVNALISNIEKKLDKSSEDFYSCKLSRDLYNSIQTTNARFIDSEIVNNLDIQLTSPSYDHTNGWDIFALKYTINSPLKQLLISSIPHYNKIFKRLWRIKQIEHIIIGKIWKKQRLYVNEFRKFKINLNTILYQLHILTSAMVLLINQISFFIFVDVIDVIWIKFKKAFSTGQGIYDILLLHNEYLDGITNGVFLTNCGKNISNCLDEVFASIEQLESWQLNFYLVCSKEIESLRARGTDIDQIILIENLLETHIALDYTEMNYKAAVNKLIECLVSTNENHLEAFAETLNVNGYYEIKN